MVTLNISDTETKLSNIRVLTNSERELSEFSQTLQTSLFATECRASDMEGNERAEWTQWVLNAPRPPTLWDEILNFVRGAAVSYRKTMKYLKEKPFSSILSVLQSLFPILIWSQNYTMKKFKSDLLAGLTLASLCIPQSIGYATLAKLAPQYGLYTSVVPPLIYAMMGTSRDMAIGPVAVVSILMSSMIQKIENPEANPIAYTRLVFTVTCFAGIFQAAFGLLRLGFVVDFLSHAAIVGFMAGTAIVIGLQQLKGLLGLTNFTNKTDIISVLKVVWRSVQKPWNPINFILGCSFLSFILITRFLKLFWVPAIAPLIYVMLSTLIVYLTRADVHGVKIVKHIKSGLNPTSFEHLEFKTPYISEVAKCGVIIAVVALTEAIAVGRSFATTKGYHLDGNKEMIAMGFMNIVGSLTSCYTATGSFSRTAVNFSAGCETVVSNIVMAITVDKLDFLACIGAFFGVLFASVEIGLLVAVIISFARIILNTIHPGIENLGRLPGSDVFCDVNQYPMALRTRTTITIRIKSSLLCFANASFIKERILKWVVANEDAENKGNAGTRTRLVVLDMSNLMNVDTSGISTLEELRRILEKRGTKLAMANPRWQVIEKLKLADFINKAGGNIFLTVGEAVVSV